MINLKDLKKGKRLTTEEVEAIENRLIEIETLFQDELPTDVETNLMNELYNYTDIIKVSLMIAKMEDNGIKVIH